MKSIKVAAAVICDGDRILSCQRSYGEFKDGWEFPGGKLEPGETAEQAAVRELREELGVTIGSLEHLCTVEYDYDTFHLTMHCYLAHVAQGHLQLLEHSAAKWVSAETIDEPAWLPADIAVVEAIKSQGIL